MSVAPDMLFHLGGVPVGNAIGANPWSRAYFVDGTSGKSDRNGTSPGRSVSTVTLGISKASAGDVVYVRQLLPVATDMTDPTAYAENLVLPVAKYNLSIVGCGNNPHNPFYTQIKASAAGYGVELKGTSFLLENLDFNKGSATTGMIFINGDNGTTSMAWGGLISHCHIRNANSAANAGIKTYAGSYNTISNCIFEACHTGINIASGGTFPIRSLKIQDCSFKASNASAVGGANIYGPGASNIIYELEILRCYFERVPTGAFIDLTSATAYGLIADCHFGDADVSCTTSSSNINKPTTVFVSGCYDDSGTMVVTT